MRQREVPRQFKLNGNTWRIRFVRVIEPPREDRETLGLCDPNIKTIFIRQRQTVKDRKNVIFHELIHAAEFEFNIKISHPDVYKLADAFTEISFVSFLKEGICLEK